MEIVRQYVSEVKIRKRLMIEFSSYAISVVERYAETLLTSFLFNSFFAADHGIQEALVQ